MVEKVEMSAVTVRPAEWSSDAAELLALAEQAASLDDLKAQVEGRFAHLFRVESEAGALLAAYVLRIDRAADGYHGVILSAAGRAGFDLVAVILPEVERRFHGVVAVRMHTARPGLIRKAARQGYRTAEFVLIKQVA